MQISQTVAEVKNIWFRLKTIELALSKHEKKRASSIERNL